MVTGLSSRLRCTRWANFPSGSRSASSDRRFCVRTTVVMRGMVLWSDGERVVMRLRASKRVWSRGRSGKLPSVVIVLSVRSRVSLC